MIGTDRDSRALRLMHYIDVDAERARYAAMALPDRRAYAALHPEFRSRHGAILPDHVAYQVSDAYNAGDDHLADAISSAYTIARDRAAALATIRASATPFGVRMLTAIAWAVMGALIAGVACTTAYLAAGAHAAIVTAVPIALVTSFMILRRLVSSRSG